MVRERATEQDRGQTTAMAYWMYAIIIGAIVIVITVVSLHREQPSRQGAPVTIENPLLK